MVELVAYTIRSGHLVFLVGLAVGFMVGFMVERHSIQNTHPTQKRGHSIQVSKENKLASTQRSSNYQSILMI